MSDENPGESPETGSVEKEWEVLVKAYKKLGAIQTEITGNEQETRDDLHRKVRFLENLEQGIESLREKIVKKYLDEPE